MDRPANKEAASRPLNCRQVLRQVDAIGLRGQRHRQRAVDQQQRLPAGRQGPPRRHPAKTSGQRQELFGWHILLAELYGVNPACQGGLNSLD